MDNRLIDAELQAQAQLAEEAFKKYLRLHYGQTTIKPRNSLGWLQIAKVCRNMGWDIVDFVNSTIPMVNKTHYYITPTDLINAAIKYKELNIQDEWDGFKKELLTYMSEGLEEEDVLLNPFYSFPAWFRCLYSKIPSEKVIEYWGNMAAEEIRDNTKLVEFAKNNRPDNWLKLEVL